MILRFFYVGFVALLMVFSFVSLCQEVVEIEVSVSRALIYSKQDTGSKVLGKLKRGKKVKAFGPTDQGFYRLKSKSGRVFYVEAGDVQVLDFDESDLFEVNGRRSQLKRGQALPRKGPYVTWDLGFSSGSAGDINYSEAQLGVNIFFKEWLAWRNAGFYRFIDIEGVDNVYGLDSMARFYKIFDFSRLAGVTFFGGPGYRFINEGDNVPFAELGTILKIAGLEIGGGFRTFFTKFVNEDADNDTQFFIVLSGSGVI